MTLPPLPLHPEKYYNFTEAEKEIIEDYGQQCALAERERILKIVYLHLQKSGSPTWEQDWINIKSHVRYGK